MFTCNCSLSATWVTFTKSSGIRDSREDDLSLSAKLLLQTHNRDSSEFKVGHLWTTATIILRSCCSSSAVRGMVWENHFKHHLFQTHFGHLSEAERYLIKVIKRIRENCFCELWVKIWLDHQAPLGGRLHVEFLRGLHHSHPCLTSLSMTQRWSACSPSSQVTPNWGNMPCEERPREQHLFSWEERKIWGDLTAALKALREGYQDGDRLFTDVQWEKKRQWL